MIVTQLEKLCEVNDKKISPVLIELGISKSVVANWKNGAIPNGETLIKLADYFGVTTDYLLGREKSEVKNERENVKIENKATQELRFAALPLCQKLKALKREFDLDDRQLSKNLNLDYNQFEYWYNKLENEQGDNEISRVNVNLYEIYIKLSEFYNEDLKRHPEQYLREDEIKRTSLAKEIIRQRKKINDSQKALSDVIQVDEISVISWESGERIPNDRCLKELTEYLELKANTEQSSEIMPQSKTGTDD